MNTKNSKNFLIASLLVALSLTVVSIAYAELWCDRTVEVWELELLAKTVDGEPVEDLSEYHDLYISLRDSTVFPAEFHVVNPDEQREEVMGFGFDVEDQ